MAKLRNKLFPVLGWDDEQKAKAAQQIKTRPAAANTAAGNTVLGQGGNRQGPVQNTPQTNYAARAGTPRQREIGQKLDALNWVDTSVPELEAPKAATLAAPMQQAARKSNAAMPAYAAAAGGVPALERAAPKGVPELLPAGMPSYAAAAGAVRPSARENAGAPAYSLDGLSDELRRYLDPTVKLTDQDKQRVEVLLAQRQKEINAWREREQAEFEQANRTAPQMQAELTGGGAGRLRGLNAAKPTAAELWDRGVPELMTGVASAPTVYKESAELAEYMAITDALYQKQHAAAAFLGASKDSLVPTGEGAQNILSLLTGAELTDEQARERELRNFIAQNRTAQHPIASGAGALATEAAKYAVTGGALNTLGLGTSAFAGIGEAGSKAVGKLPGVGKAAEKFLTPEAVANMARDMTLDVALDTVPRTLVPGLGQLADEGSEYNLGNLAMDVGGSLALNGLFNLGGEAASQLFEAAGKKLFGGKKADVPELDPAQQMHRELVQETYGNPRAGRLEESARANTAVPELWDSVVDANPATHTAKEMKTIAGYMDSADPKLAGYVEKVLRDGPDAYNKPFALGNVNPKQADDLAAIVGFDTSGYQQVLPANSVRHIDKRHGAMGQADYSMAKVDDVARMQYVLDNYDNVSRATLQNGKPTVSTGYRNADGTFAPMVQYEKAINGTYYVIEAVPDNKNKTLNIVSAYIGKNKNGGGQVPMPPGTRDFGLDALSDVASTAMDAAPGMKAQSSAGGGGQALMSPEGRVLGPDARSENASATTGANMGHGAPAASLDQSIPFLEGNINRELLAPEHLRVPELEAGPAPLNKPVEGSLDAAGKNGANSSEIPTLGEYLDEVGWSAKQNGKSTRLQKRETSRMVNELGDALNVPRRARYEVLEPMAKEMAEEVRLHGEVRPETAERMFNEAWENGVKVKEEMYEQYRGLKDSLRTTPITLHAADQPSGSWNELRQGYFGTLRVVNEGGVPVDVRYAELMDAYPELFPASITAPIDQLERMAEVGQNIQKAAVDLDTYYGGMAGEYREMARAGFDDVVKSLEKEVGVLARYDEARILKEVKKTAQKTQVEQRASALGEDSGALMQAYEDARRLQRVADKVGSNNALTQAEVNIVDDMLSGVRAQDAPIPDGMNAKGIQQVYEAKKAVQDARAPVEMLKRERRQAKVAKAEEMLEGAAGWKDKKMGLAYSTETAERNIRDIVGSNEGAAKVIDEYFAPVHRHEAQATRWKNEILEKVEKLKLTPAERSYVQMKGELEGLMTRQAAGKPVNQAEMEHLAHVMSRFEEKYAGKIDKAKVDNALPVFQEIYDTVLKMENEAYVRNGYAPTEGLGEGYFPHFEKQETALQKVKRALGKDTPGTDLPTDIAGKTQDFKPNRRWNRHAEHREGYRTEYDALKGLEARLDVAGDVIYHSDDIQNLRALEDAVRGKFGSKGAADEIAKIRADQSLSAVERSKRLDKLTGENHLAGFARWLDEYTNLLAGKKSFADRSIEKEIGRDVYQIVNGLESRVAANMVGVNPGSWLTNSIPISQTAGEVRASSLLGGIWDTMTNPIRKDGLAGESDFLTNRLGTKRIAQSTGQKVAGALSQPMEWVDTFTSNVVTRAKFRDNIKNGIPRAEALQKAGDWAQSLMAGRSKGSMPTIFEQKNPLVKMFTMFQLEPNNQLRYLFKDMPRNAKNKGQLMKKAAFFFAGAYLFNDAYELLVGRRPALDVMGMANEAFGDFTGYQLPNTYEGLGALLGGDEVDFTTEKQGTARALGNLGKNVAEELPFVGGLLGGGRVPIQGAIPDIPSIVSDAGSWMSGEMHGSKAAQNIVGELSKPLYHTVLPVGGGQVKKAVDASKVLYDGGRYTYDGEGNRRLQYAVEDLSPGQIAQAYAFGPTALPEARQWVEGGFGSKSVRETAAFDAARAAGVKKDMFEEWWTAYGAIEPDKDAKGETIAGSSRRKALKIVQGMEVDNDQRLTLLAGADKDMAEEIEALRGYGVKSDFAVLELLGAKSVKENVRNVIFANVGLKGKPLLETYKLYSNSAQGEKMQAAYDGGVPPEAYLEYKNTVKPDENGRVNRVQSASVLLGMGLEDKQMASLYAVQNSRDEKFGEAMEAGVSAQSYLRFDVVEERFAKELGKESLNYTEKAMLALAIADEQQMKDEQIVALYSLNASEKSAEKMAEAYQSGISPKVYLTYLGNVDADGNGSVNQAEAIAALNSMNLSQQEKAKIFALQNSGWKARPFG